jgi:hypothetical protein
VRLNVLVCRGYYCGTERRHPQVDHEAQLAALGRVARIRVVGCVDACSRSNVVIVRLGDGTSLWFGAILRPATTESLSGWLAAGAPRPVPEPLAGLVFDRHLNDLDAKGDTLSVPIAGETAKRR